MSTAALSLLTAIVIARADFGLGQDKSCPGGYSHGSQVDRGRYWYECRDGQLVPKGCLTEDLRRMNLWETYDDRDGVRFQCVLDRDGYLSFSYKSCVANGREYQVNEQWEDSKNVFACKRDRDFVRVEVIGCMFDNGSGGARRVAVEEKSSKGDFVHQCRKAMDQSFGMDRVGCAYDGRQYAVGDTFDKSNHLWYMCTTNGNHPGAEVVHRVIGCVHNGQKLRTGDHYTEDDVIYGCVVDDENTRIIPVACVTRENGVTFERRVNCSWVEGDEPYQYEITCKKVEPNSAVRQYLRCMYTVPRGTLTMDPGCYRLIDATVAGCLKDANTNRLQIRTFNVDQLDQASRLGLRFC